MLNEYRLRLDAAISSAQPLPEFPEDLILSQLNNTWRDTAGEVVGNWMGLIYQITNSDRRLQFMQGVDPENPLGLA